MRRREQVVIAAVLLSLLAGCGQSQTQKEIAKHDPKEVQLLRDQAKQGKIQLDDKTLLSTLQSRDDCRTIKAALDAMTAGQKTGSAITKFTALPADNRARGQNDLATYFQGMVDKAMLGDPSQAKDYHDKSCSNTLVRTIKNMKVLTAGIAVLLAMAGAVTWWLNRPAPVSGSTAPQRAVYTVERRPFKAVVTLDAGVTSAPAVVVSRQQQGANVVWSVRTGDAVKAGQGVGREGAANAQSGSGQNSARSDLARVKTRLPRLKKTNALDIADAEAAVRAAAPADRAAARRTLTRTRLTAKQSEEDLEAQIESLSKALATSGKQPGTLTAPVTGTITISADGSSATVEPKGYLVSAPVDPLVLYRLLDDSGRPISKHNEVVLTGLATKFPCTNLKLQDKTSASEQQGAASGAAQAAAATTAVSCHVPAGIKVFPGLKATLAITVAELPEALVLDAAGIRASSDNKALVSQLDPDGRVQSRTVEIGQTDGLSVVVLDGLTEGDRVVDPSAG